MNRQEHLLTCAGEEASEVAGRASKALRFGLTEVQPNQPLSNAERIVDEFHDLYAVLSILQAEGALPADLSLIPTIERVAAKRRKIERFMAISREQGVLVDG